MAASEAPEPVLLGAAMLGATAAGNYTSLTSAMAAMSGDAQLILPNGDATPLHELRYQAFQVLQRAEAEIRRMGATVP